VCRDTIYSGYVAVHERELVGPDGQRFGFDAGCFCLELLLTGGPAPCDRYEVLHTPADLAGWLVGSRLAEHAVIREPELRIRPAELRRIKAFRDAMWSAVRNLVAGKRIAHKDLGVINESATAEPVVPRIEPRTGRRTWVSPITGTGVLGAAAREAIDILSGELAGRVRQCGADDCHLVFLDTSRPGKRRWCSMARCGNRNKVRGYRTRQTGA
jgi:predicted RNA-binding Zn ribbon-like protein